MVHRRTRLARPRWSALGAAAAAWGSLLAMAALTACLGDELTAPAPTSTLAAPSTTHVPVELGGRQQDSERVHYQAAPMLDGEMHVMRSDDPATPFVDGEPVELRRIHDLAVADDCDQLHDTLEFWLRFVGDGVPDAGRDDDAGGVDVEVDVEVDVDDAADDEAIAGARRASAFARAAFDAIAYIQCGPRP